MTTQSRPLFKDPRVWIIAAFAIGISLGPGILWNWKASELSSAVSTAELRKSQEELDQSIMALAGEYLAAAVAYAKSPSDVTYRKMVTLHGQLENNKASFGALEERLAKLEGRAPRTIQLEFRLPSPQA